MRSFGIVLIAAALVMFSWTGFGQDKEPRAALAGSVEVELPIGNVKIQYVESKYGMVLYVATLDTSVQAQRLYLGDGKNAVAFEASSKGFMTPNGPVNAAMVEYENGSVFKVPRGKREAWGSRRGEVYVHTPGLKFQLEKE